MVKGGGRSEPGVSIFPGSQLEVSKHMIVIGIQWDIAGYIDQHTIGR